MKINNFTKNIIITSMAFGAMVLSGTTSSKAVLQSNGNTGATYNLSDWMINVRKMEELGGAMGLSETLNSNLTSSSSSNGIDVHMQKNTEYGALAILSASSYGNPNKVNDGETTTGNATGVVMKLNYEWVAGMHRDALTGYVSRYKNTYDQSYVAKNGDAIAETAGWHGSGSSQWIWEWLNDAGVVRAVSGSIFSYYARSHTNSGSQNVGHINNLYRSRAVIVQGEGI